MNQEIEAAAERLKKILIDDTGKLVAYQYHDIDSYCDSEELYESDRIILCREYLAIRDQQACEAEEGVKPITEDWWASICNNDLCFIWITENEWLDWVPKYGLSLETSSESILLPKVATRGQVLGLIGALGINTKSGEK